MTDKTPPSQPPTSSSKGSTSKIPPAYISSSGQTLTSLPLSARLNRFADNIYNFLGLYLVSLLSLDPYTAAQSSRFNTRGPGRNSGNNSTSTSSGSGNGIWGGGRVGGNPGSGNNGPQGGGGGAGGGAGGRRVGTVDDVRGPECGSCGWKRINSLKTLYLRASPVFWCNGLNHSIYNHYKRIFWRAVWKTRALNRIKMVRNTECLYPESQLWL